MISRRSVFVALSLLLAACTQAEGAAPATTALEATTTAAAPTTGAPGGTTTSEAPATTTTAASPYARPEWLGTRPLPVDADGVPLAQPTPPELQDRQFETIDYLPPPGDEQFHSTIEPVPVDVLARSTWTDACPVAAADLAYVTVSHYGFDHEFHTGELLVNATVAADIVGVFARLYDARYPIEQMRVTSQAELDAIPTGDGNVTGSFVCRPSTGADHWSQHAYGLAIDINPFQNPYEKGEIIIPELATSYTDRSRELPGMISAGDVVTTAFADIGWGWGGDWNTLKDWMHFSQNGR